MTDAAIFWEKLNKAKSILLIAHRRPDGDCLGATAALIFYLQKNTAQKVSLFCSDALPAHLNFLPLTLNNFLIARDQILKKPFDLVVAVDCADLAQAGLTEEWKQLTANTINLDHHQTNSRFAQLNIINDQASSTCEILFQLMLDGKVTISKEIGQALLLGLLSDTQFFTTTSTNQHSLSSAARLMSSGANLKQLTAQLKLPITSNSLKVWGKILSRLHYNEEKKILAAIIRQEDRLGTESLDGLADFLNQLQEPNFVIVINEAPNQQLRCCLRTNKKHINVAEIAQRCGGGGHAKAAGFSLSGKLIQRGKEWEII